MDGVLFDSMPAHAKAWTRAMNECGFEFTEADAYMNEGRTGSGTIRLIAERQGRSVSDEEIQQIYALKSTFFLDYPPAEPMPGAAELLQKLHDEGTLALLVTGSGTPELLGRLQNFYPGVFVPERMVTAFDVRKGKPDPEPFLMGLHKGSAALGRPLLPSECVVVENAPLGVQAAVAAGIPTIAVNTGPLPPDALLSEGARWLFPSMQALCDNW
jgi:HAD superfamily hydrolase (TIGR01509 family)